MKVLYISTVFPSEKSGSTIYTDIAEELVSRGHNVTVVAGEEKKKSVGTRLTKERGCDVLWVKTGNMYDVGKFEKGISVITLSNKFISAIKSNLSDKSFDLILFEAPPATLAKAVKFSKKLYDAPAYLMMKDIFPQNALDIGLMNKGPIFSYFKLKERQLYKTADMIGCMSRQNRKYILEHNAFISKSKTEIFPNCKKISEIPKRDLSFPLRKKYNIPTDSVLFVLGGNMGKPQALPFVCDAVKQFKDNPFIHFLFVGRGTEWNFVKSLTEDFNNTTLLENLSRDEYEKLICECDVGIVSLDFRFTIPNYPSRILSYMEYAMPVLTATDLNTDFKELTSDAECGFWCASNDLKGFCDNILKLASDKTLRKNLGMNGRRYMEKNFSVTRSALLLEKFIKNR